jgi:hypothetical protein
MSGGLLDPPPHFALLLQWHEVTPGVLELEAVAWGDPPADWLRNELRILADGFTFRTAQSGENRPKV